MKKIFKKLILILLFLLIIMGCEQKDSVPLIKGQYMGQSLSGDQPEIFKPDLISTGAYERDITISPDGKEIYLGVAYGQYMTIIYSRFQNGRWTKLQVAPFAQDPRYFYFEPHVTPDGNRLLFLCTRPPEGKEPKPGWFYQNIWAVDRLEDGSWSKAYDIGAPVNTENNEYYPTVTNEGTLYFTRSIKGSDKTNIYRSQYVNGNYAEPELLPEEVNGQGNPYNTFIAPDESYLIACVAGKDTEKPGTADHYIFFRDQNDHWSEGIKLDEKINIPGQNASSQYVSPDGNYFFFAASLNKFADEFQENNLSLDLLKRMRNQPRNGSSDIYWMKTDFIDKLKNNIFIK